MDLPLSNFFPSLSTSWTAKMSVKSNALEVEAIVVLIVLKERDS